MAARTRRREAGSVGSGARTGGGFEVPWASAWAWRSTRAEFRAVLAGLRDQCPTAMPVVVRTAWLPDTILGYVDEGSKKLRLFTRRTKVETTTDALAMFTNAPPTHKRTAKTNITKAVKPLDYITYAHIRPTKAILQYVAFRDRPKNTQNMGCRQTPLTHGRCRTPAPVLLRRRSSPHSRIGRAIASA